jgi:hypothetical protein
VAILQCAIDVVDARSAVSHLCLQAHAPGIGQIAQLAFAARRMAQRVAGQLGDRRSEARLVDHAEAGNAGKRTRGYKCPNNVVPGLQFEHTSWRART